MAILVGAEGIAVVGYLKNVLSFFEQFSVIGTSNGLVKYISKYSARQLKRHRVKPGITGLAQINGRNYLPWKDSLELDVVYVEKFSFNQDIKILVKTVVLLTGFRKKNDLENEIRGPFEG